MTIKVPSKTQYVALAKTIRCVSECNAVTLPTHRIGFFEKKYWLFRADILHGSFKISYMAVEDILNGQRSTTALRIVLLTQISPIPPKA